MPNPPQRWQTAGEFRDSLAQIESGSPDDCVNTLAGGGVSLKQAHDRIRKIALERFDLSLGTGLGKLQNRVFRIGHLGWFNDLMLCGTLCGVEMSLGREGGVKAAMTFLEPERSPS